MLPIVSAEFWVATDPDLKFTPSGSAVLKMRLKAQDRTYDPDKKDWVNGKELWVNGTVWRQMAENTLESIKKGDNVVVSGKLHTNQYEDKSGNRRESLELEILEIGPSLRFRTTPHGASTDTAEARSDTRQGTGTRTPATVPETGADDGPGW